MVVDLGSETYSSRPPQGIEPIFISILSSIVSKFSGARLDLEEVLEAPPWCPNV